jgi:hypothetical protein
MPLRRPPFVLLWGLSIFFAALPAAAAPPAVPPVEAPKAIPPATPAAPPADPDPADPVKIYDDLLVTGRAADLLGVADSATEGSTGREDLARRPVLRPGELLETVPGVIITQHSGSGKANQYFLRGFNLDHGTDFRINLDGMQVNSPSHGHGQGYADLNFVIPELVEAVVFRKGTYDAQDGDFSAAGAADLELADQVSPGLVKITGGTFGYGRLLVADSFQVGEGHLLGALEASRSDGPWDRPEDARKTNGALRYSVGDAARGFTLTALGYDNSWNSSDQIPRRAVESGAIGPFGEIDRTDGGASDRYSLSLDLRRGGGTTLDSVHLYALSYSLNLFSNFTYFLDDPVNGDQFEQDDRRQAAGLEIHRQESRNLFGREIELTTGFDLRSDKIRNGLFSTVARRRLSTTREDDIRETLAAPFGQARIAWKPWLRTVIGLRADAARVSVDSSLAENSGQRDALIASPKLSVLLGPWRNAEIYLNWGRGFHSNDARGATIRVDPKSGEPATRVPLLVRAESADLGLRWQPLPSLRTTISAFRLDLDSELVFVGDAGGTEASRPSRRQGVELTNFWRPRPWLAIDADLSVSRARFADSAPEGNRIPGAIARVFAAGIAIEPQGPLSGGIRLRYFGPRDLIEDGSVRSRSSAQVNARLAWKLGAHLELAGEAFNLLDAQVSDIDYFYASRLPGEPAEGVEDRHYHPAEPRAFRLSVEWKL